MATLHHFTIIFLALYASCNYVAFAQGDDQTTSGLFDCSNIGEAVENGGTDDESPIYKALIESCPYPVCSRDAYKAIEYMADDVWDICDAVEGHDRLTGVKNTIESFIAEHADLSDVIKSSVITIDAVGQQRITVTDFFTCVENITDSCNFVHEMVATNDGIIPLWQSVKDVCALSEGLCTRPDRIALATLANAIDDRLNQASEVAQKIKAGEVLIEQFVDDEGISGQLKDALMSMNVYGFNADVGKFMSCARNIIITTTTEPITTTTQPPPSATEVCLEASRKFLDDHGILDNSEIFKTLDRACIMKPCLLSERTSLDSLAMNVSDNILFGFANENDKLLNVTTMLRIFIDSLDKNGHLYAAVASAQLSDWGTIAEFLTCEKHAMCANGFEVSLKQQVAEDDWCLLLNAVQYCDGCSRTDRAISSVWADEILLGIAGKSLREKGTIATHMIKEYRDKATPATAEATVAGKIYATVINGWGKVEDLIECAVEI